MAVTDDRPVVTGADPSDAIQRRELLPTERELALGAEATDFQASSTAASKHGVKSLFRSFLRDLNPLTIEGPKLPLFILAGLAMFQAWDDIVVGVVYPQMRADFTLNLTFVIVISSVIGIVTDVAGPFVGWVVDRVKRVWVVRAGALILHSSSILFALAGTFGAFLTARGMAITGVALLEPSQQPVTVDHYPTRSRVRVFSFIGVASLLGLSLAPLLGGYVSDSLNWRATVALFGGLGMIVTLIAMFFLREPRRGYWDLVEAGLPPELAETMPRPTPLPFVRAFRVGWGIKTLRKFWWATLFMPATLAGEIYVFVYLAGQGYDARQRGVVGAIAGLSALVFIPVTGAVANRLVNTNPSRIMSLLGGVYFVQAAALVGIALAPSPLIAVILLVPFMATVGFIVPSVQAAMSLIMPPSMLGIGLQTNRPFRLAARVVLIISVSIGPMFAGLTASAEQATLLALAIPTLLGGFVLASGTSTMAGDIRTARATAVAELESDESRRRGKNKMLICRDVDVTYDGVQVLFGVDLDVDEGELVALLGTNGAGKSTLMRAICGLQRASNGAIFLDGFDITQEPPHLNARRGIVFVPGGHAIFPGLTVAENLQLAAQLGAGDNGSGSTRTDEVLDLFPVLRDRLSQKAGDMSGGEQQMLAVGQALLMKPRLLMIDELSLGLAPAVIDTLLQTIRRINAEGATVVLIEQSLNVAMTIARRAVFMEKGEIRFDGPTGELMGRPELVRAVFMGGAATGGSRARTRGRRFEEEARERVLEVQDVSIAYGGVRALDHATLSVGPDEIVGIIGPNGAGKTTLFDIISGFAKPDSGTVLMSDVDVTTVSPEQRAQLGLGRSFQNAHLFPSLTVRENIAVAMERAAKVKSPLLHALWLPSARRSERLVSRRVDGLVDLLRLGAVADKFVNELSTGTRRSVDIACIMAAAPKMLLLDEPSSGLAQAEAEALGPVIERVARDAGCSILVIEHDIGLVSSISHRLYAMELGTVVTSGTPEQVVSDPRVLSSYLAATEDVLARSDLSRALIPAGAPPNQQLHQKGETQ